MTEKYTGTAHAHTRAQADTHTQKARITYTNQKTYNCQNMHICIYAISQIDKNTGG